MESKKIPTTIEELLELKYDKMLETIHPPRYSSDKREHLPKGMLTELLVSLLKDDERSGIINKKAFERNRMRFCAMMPTYEPTVTIRTILDEFFDRKGKFYYTPEQLEEILWHVDKGDDMYSSDYCQMGETLALGELLEGHLAFLDFREEHAEYFKNRLENLKSLLYKEELIFTWRVLCAIGTRKALKIVKKSLKYAPFAEHAIHLKDMKGWSSLYGPPLNRNISKNAKKIYRRFALRLL